MALPPIMLIEAKEIVQRQGEPRKRWFMSSYFDLIVWLDKEHTVRSFELCYGKPDTEKVLCWSEEKGYSHLKVDDGEAEPLKYKMTPIYVPDGLFDKHSVIERFMHESVDMDGKLRDSIIVRLADFALQDTYEA